MLDLLGCVVTAGKVAWCSLLYIGSNLKQPSIALQLPLRLLWKLLNLNPAIPTISESVVSFWQQIILNLVLSFCLSGSPPTLSALN